MADPKKPRPAFAPWDRRELPGAFTVEETAKRVGHYKWIEMKLFEALGGWVATVPELDVKMRLGTHCYHHAWHAELWHKRLPELREMNPDRLTLPANPEIETFVEAMTEPEEAGATIEKLVGVYRVLIPHKIAAYTYHRNNTSTITDAPTIRTLELILRDEFDDWRDGEMLLQSLITTDDEVDRAAAHQARLEKLVLAAGGIAGPGSIGFVDGEAVPRPGRLMARVTVTPQEFHFVSFDAARIAELVGEVAAALGVADGDEVRVEIDERVPLGRVTLRGVDPIDLLVEGSAFEDAKHLRQQRDKDVIDVTGRWIVRALDRRSPGFADAPAEDDVPVGLNVAWTVSCAGRCQQAGFEPRADRWRYHWRNRHGFTDVSDACFDRLWADPAPTWGSIVAASEEAAASRQPVT